MSEAVMMADRGVARAVAEVCRAAAASARGRAAVSGLVHALRRLGLDEHAMDLEPLGAAVRPARALDGGAWLNSQWATGKVSGREVRAGVDIRHALALQGHTGSIVDAVDPTRLIVDGGAATRPLQPTGGRSLDPSVVRYAAWHRAVRDRVEARRRVLRGRLGSMAFVKVVEAVLVDGASPAALDKRLGVRHGRCASLVIIELRAYAQMHKMA